MKHSIFSKVQISPQIYSLLALAISYLCSRIVWIPNGITSLISTAYIYLILVLSIPLTGLNCIVSIISPGKGGGRVVRNSLFFLAMYVVAVLAIMAAMFILGLFPSCTDVVDCNFSFNPSFKNMVIIGSVAVSIILGFALKYLKKDGIPHLGMRASSVKLKYEAFVQRHSKIANFSLLPLFFWPHNKQDILMRIQDAVEKLGRGTKWCSRWFPLVIFSLSHSFLSSTKNLGAQMREFFGYLLLAWIAQVFLFLFMFAVLWILKKTVRGHYWKYVWDALTTANSIPSINEILSKNSDKSLQPTAVLLSKAGSFIEICAGVIFLGMRHNLNFSPMSVLFLASVLLVHLIPFTAVPMGGAVLLKTIMSIYGLNTESDDTGVVLQPNRLTNIPNSEINILKADTDAILSLNLLTDMPGSALNAFQSAVVSEATSRLGDDGKRSASS